MWLPISAFLLAAVGTPVVARFARDRGLVGRDCNKIGLPEVPEGGGLALLAILSLFLVYLDYTILSVVVILIGLFSFIDDIYQYGTIYKVAFPLLISSLFYFEVGLPGLLFAVPYFVLIVNLSNTLAGFNGLEMGLGAFIAIFLACFLYLTGSPFAELLLVLAGACMGFLIYNWYPARVFPGDVGTYTVGAVLAGVGILSGCWYVLLFLFIPHVADMALKAYSTGIPRKIIQRSPNNTLSEYGSLVNKNGKLYLPKKSYLSLIRVLLYKPRSEQEIVLLLLLIEASLGALVLLAVAL